MKAPVKKYALILITIIGTYTFCFVFRYIMFKKLLVFLHIKYVIVLDL